MKLDIQLYRGYVNDQELIVFGHVFKSWAPDKYEIDRRGYHHAKSVIKMFTINPINNMEVTLHFKGLEITTKTLNDGYFRFSIPFNQYLDSGWHHYEVSCGRNGAIGIVEQGELLKPFKSKLAIISDIDDTFLISHSHNFFKKLYIVLSKNIDSREIYSDVVPHFQALSRSGQDKGAFNSFFYVSSSEWNLYEFILQFASLHELPKAIIKLKKIKTGLFDFLFSGRGSHDHKFIKIKDIVSFYPQLEYVLLGDDSQQDAYLYERVCKFYPKNIKAIYIRQTRSRKKNKIKKVLSNIEDMHVATCYFENSGEAIAHSKKIGII